MQLDFHYYATYCAAFIAGYTAEESLETACSAQFVDCCSRTLLKKIGGPAGAATTQLQLELMEAPTNIIGRQDITRIWASFHFLPGDLYAQREKRCSKRYLMKYRLICMPNSELLRETVELAQGKGTAEAGLAMHVLADTWAHRNFAGTPSLSVNNTDGHFYEFIRTDDGWEERKIKFNNNPGGTDDPDKSIYTKSLYQSNEHSIMNLGHGRAGHLPDYSYARYKYLPAWGNYKEMLKNNPDDYLHAFCQMIYALKCLKEGREFTVHKYDTDAVAPYADRIWEILTKRQTDACADWKAFAEDLSGTEVPDFSMEKYEAEYKDAEAVNRDGTFLGRFISAALRQKSMVTNRIYRSGSRLAGVSKG